MLEEQRLVEVMRVDRGVSATGPVMGPSSTLAATATRATPASSATVWCSKSATYFTLVEERRVRHAEGAYPSAGAPTLDAAGREVRHTTPWNATVSTSYDGLSITVTDALRITSTSSAQRRR